MPLSGDVSFRICIACSRISSALCIWFESLLFYDRRRGSQGFPRLPLCCIHDAFFL